jgi:hypothetical protein
MHNDFRVAFAKMADQAIVNRVELAELLGTSPGALSQMAYRGELPLTAFPEKRRAVWFVRDIRKWLDEAALKRHQKNESFVAQTIISLDRRIGRPRFPIETSKKISGGNK